MSTRRCTVRVLTCLVVSAVAASCATTGGVRITRSDQRADSRKPSGTTTTEDSTPPVEPVDPPDPVAWNDCPDQPAPWQCGSIRVPMNYRDTEGRQIFIALTRLPATGSSNRIGSLILNPGGPGGSGIELAYAEGEEMPPAIRERFDIVGFDPRGVGRSTAARCPADFNVVIEGYDRCIAETGDLLKYLGTPNVARDLDQIRAAVGDPSLTYLGYSYGTAIGGVYADLFPDRVRALVLDGSIDPLAGRSNTGQGGSDFYANQDFEGTVEVFEALCDATLKCAAGPSTADLVGRVESEARDLPVTYFPGDSHINRRDVDDLISTSMYSVSYWPLLSVALRDADDGDGSTLAALYSWLQYGYPVEDGASTDFDFAHDAITCADFNSRGFATCDGYPDTADALPEITAVDTPNPIVVVGTVDDPATPGRYSPLMANALGDAVSIQWEGAGHTAFLTSDCITDLVTKYIVDLVVPDDRESCPFVPGASTLAERADFVFQNATGEKAITSITDVLVAEGDSEHVAECVASHLVLRGDQRLIVHELLGVASPELVSVRKMMERGCQAGG